MPRDYEQVKKDVYKRLRKMRLAGDFKGMADYYNNVCERAIMAEDMNIDDYENSEYKLEANAVQDYFSTISSYDMDSDRYPCFVSVQNELLKKRTQEGAKLLNSYEYYQKRVENNEIEGTELLRDDPKTVSKLGSGLASGSSSISGFKAANIAFRSYYGLWMETDTILESYDSSKHGKKIDYLDKKRAPSTNEQTDLIRDEAIYNDPSIPEDKKEEYRKSIPEHPPMGDEHIIGGIRFDYSRFDPSKPIAKEPAYLKKIKQIGSVEEIDRYIEELKKDKDALLLYEEELRKFVLGIEPESKQLLEELKARDDGTDEASQAFEQSISCLDSLSKTVDSVNRGKLDPLNKPIITRYSISSDIENIQVDSIKESDPELGEKVKSFTERKIGELDKVWQQYGQAVSEKPEYSGTNSFLTSKMIDKIIKTAEKKKHLLELKQAFPEETADIAAKHKECTERNKKIDAVNDYLYSANRSKEMLAQPADIMAKDKATRKDNPSDTYNNFISQLERLQSMDPTKVSPEQYLGQLYHVQSAALVYENAHTGVLHPFTGWRDDAKERIDCSRRTNRIVSLMIKDLEPKVKKITPYLNDMAPDQMIQELNAQNDAVRNECKAREQQLEASFAFAKDKEASKEAVAEAYLKGKYEADINKYLADHPELNDEQRQQIRDNVSVDNYVRDTKPEIMGNEDFRKFMDNIKDTETLEQIKAMAQSDSSKLYDTVNTVTAQRKQAEQVEQAAHVQQQEEPEINEKKFSLDAKIKEAQKKLKQHNDAHHAPPNKLVAKFEYATIAVANLVKALQKENQMLDIDEKGFHDLVADTADTSKPFNAVISKNSDKEMFDKATYDNGQNLYSSYRKAQTQFMEHQQRKNAPDTRTAVKTHEHGGLNKRN
ncbi:MAG: hypothetical protein IKP42_04800 [Ruminococcus sp.]|nr:hypothetical protein [Ruminococcus sp.]